MVMVMAEDEILEKKVVVSEGGESGSGCEFKSPWNRPVDKPADSAVFGISKTSKSCLKTLPPKRPHRERTRPYITRGSLKRGVEESKGKRRAGIYDIVMELPTYFLFESSSGYALLLALGLQEIKEHNYESAEKFINRRFDEVFKLVAFRPFASTDGALNQLNAISKGIVSDELIEFLVDNLPKVTGGASTFVLALFEGIMMDQIVVKTRIACACSRFHKDIMRGARMHIDKFIKDMKPGDLKKAQLDLARLYSKQRVNSA